MNARTGVRSADLAIYGAPLAAVGLATLFILNPGILSPDSVDQWAEARGWYPLADWHPLLETLWIRLWSFARTPALPIAVQTLAMAGVVGFGCWLQRSAGIPVAVVAFAAVLAAVWPPTVALDATLWKDVPYAVAVLAGTLLLYQCWHWPETAGRRSFLVGLGLCIFAAAAFRHNGVIAAVCLPVTAALLAWPERRRILVVAVVALVGWAGVSWAAKKITGVPPVPVGYVAIGYLASHVAAGTPLRPEEARFLDGMHPLAGGWPYECGRTDPVVYDGKFNGQPLLDDGWAPVRLLAKLTLRRPGATFRHMACASQFIWDPTLKEMTGPAIWSDGTELRTNPDGSAAVPRPPSWALRRWLLRLLLRTLRPRVIDLFWSPAVALYALLLAAGLAALRLKDPSPLLILLPLLAQTAILILIVPTPHVRYQFAVLLSAYVLVPGFLYLAFTARPPSPELSA